MVGVTAVIVFVFIVIGGAGIVDILLEIYLQPPLAYLLRHWAKQYPLYSAGLVLVLGALLGHFVLHIPCVPGSVPNCG